MKPRTKNEIRDEIAALKALEPVGVWASKTRRSIELAIEQLEHGCDDTAEEFSELSDEHQDIILQTRRWEQGEINDRPSEGWGPLVK